MLILLCLTEITFAQCPQPVVPVGDTNLVVNGGFETGSISPSNVGIHSYVAPTCNCSSPGRYTIGAQSELFNIGLINGVTPHSGSNMLMIDNVLASNAVAWEQTITVEPNKVYYFSAWLTALSPVEKSEMIFQIEANSITSDLGDYFIPPNGPDWEQYFGTWNSGLNTSATIRLINTNPNVTGGGGNDYALDDIEFVASCVGVEAGPVPNLGGDEVSLCNWGGAIDLNTNVADDADHTYTWYYNGSPVTNATTPDILESQSTLGTYVACLDSSGCVNSDTIEVVANLVVDLGADVELCDPSTKQLNTNITVPDNFTIEWYRDNVLIPNEDTTYYLATGAGTYRVDVTDNLGGSCNGSDEIVITSSVPEPVNDTICPVQGDDAAMLSVIGSGAYKWWDAETGGSAVGAGSTLNLTGLTGPVTYYVGDTTAALYTAGFADQSTFGGNGLDPNIDYATMKFTALANATLDSATALMNGTGTYTITFTNVTTSTTITDNGTGGTGSIVVPMGYSLVAGNEYTISVTRSGQMNYFWPASGVSFPIAYDLIQLDGGVIANFPTALFDWHLSAQTSCSRVPVEVEEFCDCDGPQGITLTTTGTDTICAGGSFNEVLQARVTNPTLATFEYDFYRNGVLQVSSLDSNYTVTQEGDYYVIIKNQAEPTCSDQSSTYYFVEETPPTADAGVDSTLCISTPDLTLYGSVNGVTGGTWSGGAGTYSTSATDLSATYSPSPGELTAGQVTLTLTSDNSNFCTGTTDEMTIFFEAEPIADAGVNDTICEDGMTTLNGSLTDATGATWTGGSGTFSTSNTDLSAVYTPSAAEITAGFVDLTLEPNAGSVCAGQSSIVRIVIDAIPTTAAGTDLTICESTPEATLAGVITGATGGTWSGAGTFIDATDLGTDYTPSAAELSAGMATVTLTSDANGKCSGTTDEVDIIIETAVIPSVSIDTLTTLCLGYPVDFGITTITNEGIAPTYDWQVNSVSTGSSDQFTISTLVTGDVVTLVLTSDESCTTSPTVTSNSITVTMNDCECPDLVIPNAFSPNGDMLNDVWEFELDACYEYHSVSIYNRWGTRIFYSQDYDGNFWDGTLNGKDMPMATYYYIVEVKKPLEDEVTVQSGSVTIIK